jgi:proline racemase
LEAPAGIIPIRALCQNNKVLRVTLQNAPSYVRYHNVYVDVPFIGWIAVDIIYSGMWYCVVDLSTFTQSTLKKIYEINQMSNATTIPDPCPPIDIIPTNGKILCRVGEMIKVACREQYPVNHEQIDYPGCDILVFMENAEQAVHRKCSKNTVVMSNGELDWSRPETWTGMLDRSPCGTGC